MRDPYAIYARHILGLEALDPLDAEPGAADRGIALHDALDEFLQAHPAGLLPADALARVRGAGREASRRAAGGARPSAPSGGRASSAWPAGSSATENARRAAVRQAAGERNRWRAAVEPPGRPLAHRSAGRPHRRDRAGRLGDHRLQDRPRALAQGARGPVRAAAAARGGDRRAGRLRGASPAGARRAPVLLAGQRPGDGGEVREIKDERAAGRRRCWRWSARWSRTSTIPRRPMRALPWPDFIPHFNDYAHLERVAEWSTAGGGEE